MKIPIRHPCFIHVNCLYPPHTKQTMRLFVTRTVFVISYLYCLQLIKHLKTVWLDTIAFNIRMCLGDLGKGWFNIGERKHEIYDSAKLMRFMELVKYHMQVNYILEFKFEVTRRIQKFCMNYYQKVHISGSKWENEIP